MVVDYIKKDGVGGGWGGWGWWGGGGGGGGMMKLGPACARLGQTIQQNGPSIKRSSSNVLLMAPTASGPVCHQVQQATSPCLTDSRPPGLGSGRPQSTLGGIW